MFSKKMTSYLQNCQGICTKELLFSPEGNLVCFDLRSWRVLKVKKMLNSFLRLRLKDLFLSSSCLMFGFQI